MKTMKKVIIGFVFAMAMFMFASTDSSAATAPITNLHQSKDSESSVQIDWATTLGAKRYYTYLSTDGVNWTQYDYTGASYPTEYISGLSAGTMYYAKVRAYSDTNNTSTILAESDLVIATCPTRAESITQIGATANNLTLSWQPVTATGYDVYLYNGYQNLTYLTSSATTSVVVPSLLPNTSYELSVVPYIQTPSGYKAMAGSYYHTSYKTLPNQVTNFGCTTVYQYIDSMTFGWTASNADGYVFQVYNYKGKLISSQDVTSTSANLNLAKGQCYKYRVAPYVKAGAAKIMGAWSGYKYFGMSKELNGKATKSGSRRKIQLSFTKVAGATKYKVYTSTKEKSGYKLVKTLKSNKRSLTITKIAKKSLKKSKDYYVKVIAVGKYGKKTYASSINRYLNVKFYS